MWYGTGVMSCSFSLLPTSPPTAVPFSVLVGVMVATKSTVAVPPGLHVHFGGAIVMPSQLIVELSSSVQLPELLLSTFLTVMPSPAVHQKLLMKPTSLRFWTSSV